MHRIVDGPQYEVWFDEADRPLVFQSPFQGADFALMLVVNDADIPSDDREQFCRQLVKAGCRYAVCAGLKCERWEDAID